MRAIGLRARMTASYVLVTAAAVIVVEGLIGALVIPGLTAEAALGDRVRNTASQYAADYSGILTKLTLAAAPGGKEAFVQAVTTIPIGQAGVRLGPGQERDVEEGVLIPRVEGVLPDRAAMSLALLLSTEGRVLSSSYPGRYRPGDSAMDWLPGGWVKGAGGVSQLAQGRVAWASEPVLVNPKLLGGLPVEVTGKGGKGSQADQAVAFVYVQVPVPASPLPSPAALASLLQPGLLMLLAVVPVGVVFGLLTTRATIRRLRRLAAGTLGFAAGDLSQRVPESNEDEVGQLERHFNRMAERLAASIEEQRLLAESNARLGERSRISRELHDSISQDLFSMSALVGGLRRALPADSAVRPQLDALDRTVTSTIQEMRALLLELRPTALDEKGLVPALAELCEAYEARVGVRVRADLEPVGLGPAAEQTVFRIAQEGLSNAVRHSEAEAIDVGLRRRGAEAELTVADDGRGFARDAAAGGHGLGLKLMSERVRELGGTLTIDSEPGRGTALRVLLPA